jgi:hypothetical protein
VCSLKWQMGAEVARAEQLDFRNPRRQGEEHGGSSNRVEPDCAVSHRGGPRNASGVRFCAPLKDGQTARLTKMYGTAWKSARERAANAWERVHGTLAPDGFRRVRVHDPKHTFGRRLRAAGSRSRIDRICWGTRAAG